MRPPIRADDIHALPVDNRRRRRAGAAFRHISPVSVRFVVTVNPKNLAHLRVETMQTLFGHRLDQIHIKNKDALLRDNRAREPAAYRLPPLNF